MRLLVLLTLLSCCTADAGAPDAACPSMQVGAGVTVIALDPDPPARFVNRWTVHVEDAAGAPVGADRVTVTTFMPAHGHAGAAPDVTADGDDLVIAPIDLWMPGVWQVDLHVDDDLVRIEVCVPE